MPPNTTKVRFSYVSVPFIVDDDVRVSGYATEVDREMANHWKKICDEFLTLSAELEGTIPSIQPTGGNFIFNPLPSKKLLRQL